MSKRNNLVRKNIILSVVFKGLSVGLSLLLLPLTVNYLSKVEYGIWVTLLGVLSWVNYLDIGIGPGLRNKLTESVSLGDMKAFRSYLSSGIAMIGGICFCIFIIFLGGLQIINLNAFLNTNDINGYLLYYSTLYTGIIVLLLFFFSIMDQVYNAFQKTALPGMVGVIQSILMLGMVYYLTYFNYRSMLYFIIAFGFSALISKLGICIWFFSKHKQLLPHYNLINSSHMKGLVTLSGKFMLLNLTCIFIYSSANFMITLRLGPEFVRDFDVVFRVFYFISTLYFFMFNPLWSAYTDAYVKKDFIWIQKTLKRTTLLIIPVSVVVVVVGLNINFITKLWTGLELDIPGSLPITIGFYTIGLYWLANWNYFINGSGLVNIEIIVSVIAAVGTAILSWMLMPIMGTTGMALAMAVIVFLFGTAMCIQTIYILKNKL
ncbi:hypothetical protein [uncultured Veillonella sp.]|uniref:hypothetical protein n=1 Tax=uncultured Veillonella sp. TaxID=159268 RepID=UPI002599D57A|nr:hypothetical protein [uncultured Veillonella sp.]